MQMISIANMMIDGREARYGRWKREYHREVGADVEPQAKLTWL
jgi:hypothetical protein